MCKDLPKLSQNSAYPNSLSTCYSTSSAPYPQCLSIYVSKYFLVKKKKTAVVYWVSASLDGGWGTVRVGVGGKTRDQKCALGCPIRTRNAACERRLNPISISSCGEDTALLTAAVVYVAL